LRQCDLHVVLFNQRQYDQHAEPDRLIMSLPWHSNQHGVGFKYLQVDAIVQMDRASSSTPVNKVCTMRISPLLSQFRHSFCVFSDLCAGVPDISLSCPAKCGKMLSFQLSSTSWVLFYLFGFKLSRSGLLVM